MGSVDRVTIRSAHGTGATPRRRHFVKASFAATTRATANTQAMVVTDAAAGALETSSAVFSAADLNFNANNGQLGRNTLINKNAAMRIAAFFLTCRAAYLM